MEGSAGGGQGTHVGTGAERGERARVAIAMQLSEQWQRLVHASLRTQPLGKERLGRPRARVLDAVCVSTEEDRLACALLRLRHLADGV